MSAEGMLDGICEALRGGLVGGETKVHVSIARELTTSEGFTQTEFIVIDAFKCASEECGLPFHVRVHGTAPQFEYPQHLAHREEGHA